MGSNWGDTNTNSLVKNILNHARMSSLMWHHEVLSNYSVAHNVPYVLGETNSISVCSPYSHSVQFISLPCLLFSQLLIRTQCQGQLGLSDVFAASLWSVDYILYVATLQISRIYFHNGTPYRYSAWQPIAIDSTPAQVKPLFYGKWFIAAALAGGTNKSLSW